MPFGLANIRHDVSASTSTAYRSAHDDGEVQKMWLFSLAILIKRVQNVIRISDRPNCIYFCRTKHANFHISAERTGRVFRRYLIRICRLILYPITSGCPYVSKSVCQNVRKWYKMKVVQNVIRISPLSNGSRKLLFLSFRLVRAY